MSYFDAQEDARLTSLPGGRARKGDAVRTMHINAHGQCRGIEIAPERWSGCRGEADCPSCHGALEGDCATEKQTVTAEAFKARVLAMLDERIAKLDRSVTEAANRCNWGAASLDDERRDEAMCMRDCIRSLETT